MYPFIRLSTNNVIQRNLLQSSRLYSSNGGQSHRKSKGPILSSRSYSSGPGDGGSTKSSFFPKFMGLSVLVGGGLVLGCYLSDDFRKTVEDNIPYSQEAFISMFGPPTGTSFAEEKDTRQSKSQGKSKPIIVDVQQAAPVVPAPSVAPITKTEIAHTEMAKKTKEESHKSLQTNEALTQDIITLVKEAESITKRAISAQKGLEDKVQRHTQEMRKAMNSTDKDSWASVAKLHDAKENYKSLVKDDHDKAVNVLAQLKQSVQDALSSSETKGNPVLPQAIQQLSQMEYDLSNAVIKVHKAESEGAIIVQYRDILEHGRAEFKKDLDAIMPNVDPKKLGKDKMSEDELNAIIAHALKRIDQLTARLSEVESQEKKRIAAALVQQQVEDNRLGQEQLAAEMAKYETQFLLEKQKWEAQMRQSTEAELRQALAHQTALHGDHLQQVLRAQHEELEFKFAQELREHLVREQEKFQAAIETWTNRVRGIEAAVEGRAELERQARESQELWLACQHLFDTIADRRDGTKLQPLKHIVDIIREAAVNTKSGRPFVNAIVDRMPEDALRRGVYSEEELIERFDKVHKVSRRVAMVDETGAGIGKYLLSWFQSIFTLVPSKGLGAEDTVPQDLDTYNLLLSASQALHHGDLDLAVRLTTQLDGQARMVAHDWIEEARLLLEARQIARILMAFASARGATSLSASDSA